MKIRLTSVRIRDFKCIEDSEEFSVDDITCLVGKNEAGKTAILEALYKLNPSIEEHSNFDMLEYPRKKYRLNLEMNEIDINVVESNWTLDNKDFRLIKESLELELDFINEDFKILKSYDNTSNWVFEINYEKIIKHLINEFEVSEVESEILKECFSLQDIANALKSMENISSRLESLREYINEKIGSYTLTEKIVNILKNELPKFLYFDEYYKLPGRVSLNDYIKRESTQKLETGDRVFRALLALAGATPNNINNIGKLDELTAALEAVSNQISQEIFEYWSQNNYLDVKFKYNQGRPQDKPPFNNGYVFRTNIENRRHRVTINFDERSSGFVWFFSFLIWFSQIREEYGDNLIILLDEPALNLHARAQQDILRYINEKLKPKFQVIYTTHSPFMVDPNNLVGTRTVEDVVTSNEELLGTKVSEDILEVSQDTLFPLQAAIGYDITQTLFIA